MALATLDINLVARLAELQSGMDKAGQIAANTAAAIEAKFAGMKAAAVSLGAALGGAISVAGLSALFKATVDGLDKLNDLADATGATVENLSALEDIAARTGTSVDTVGDALIKLNKSLGEAKQGTALAETFKAIGLNAAELRRLDPAEALRRVAVALSGFADDGNKARLVQELFGKSIREVAPLLNDLAKSGGLNATVTKQQTEEAERFNQQLAAMAKNSEDAKRAIVGSLLPSLNSFLREIVLAKQAYGSLLSAVFDNTGPFTSGTPNERLAETVAQIAAIRTTIANADAGRTKPLFADQRKALEAEIALLEKRERFLRSMQAEEGAGGGRGFVNPGDVAKPSAPAVPDKALREPKDRQLKFELDKATEDALKALQNTDAAKILEINQALDKLFEMRASGVGGSSDIDAAIEKLRDDLEKLSPAAKAAAEAQKELASMLANTPTGQMELLQRQATVLAEELGRASDPAQQQKLAEALGQVYDRMRDIRGVVKPVADEMSEFAAQAARNIQSALGDSVLDALDNKFGSIEQLWKNMLKRMLAQAVATNLSEYLFGKGYGKTTNQLGGAAGSLVDYFRGLFNGPSTSAAIGLDYVPYDGMKTVLHRGERVLTAQQARAQDAGGGAAAPASGGLTVVVQGDASENTLRLIQGAMASFEARLMARGRT